MTYFIVYIKKFLEEHSSYIYREKDFILRSGREREIA